MFCEGVLTKRHLTKEERSTLNVGGAIPWTGAPCYRKEEIRGGVGTSSRLSSLPVEVKQWGQLPHAPAFMVDCAPSTGEVVQSKSFLP